MNVVIWIAVLFTAYFYADSGSSLQNAIFTWYLAPTALLMSILFLLFLIPPIKNKYGQDQAKIMVASFIPVVNLIFSFMFILLAISLFYNTFKGIVLKIFKPSR